MEGAVVAPEFGTWTVPGHSIRIEYSAEVAGQIRSAAVEGYLRVRHGGLETGGILFGTHQQDLVRILAWRPIVCEYARGPSFLLSEADETVLAAALASWRGDPELAPLEPVGWYHSHTRSEIFLSEQDLEYFSRFFPQPWQIALVVRPASFALVRAGFFFREADGHVHAESSYYEFPLTAARAAAEAPPPIDMLAPAVAPVPVPAPAVIERNGAPAAAEVALAPVEIASPPVVEEPRRASHWKWYAASLVILAATAFGIWQWPAPRVRLALSASDANGALRIAWDRTASPVRHAARGIIEIEDRGVHTELKLTPADLQAGSISYARQSGDVAVRLRVQPASGPPIEEATRFLKAGAPATNDGPPPPPADPAKQQLEREAEAMRARLEQQNAELSKLQQMVHQKPERAKRADPAKQPEPVAAAPVSGAPPPKIESPPPVVTHTEPPPQKVAALPAVVAPAPAPPPARAIATPAAPASGRLIWTGKLPKNGTLVIEGSHASAGVLSGRLPSQAARVSAYPGELTAQGMTVFTADTRYAHPQSEAASEQNGWNRTTFTWDPKRASSVHVIEHPTSQNGYRVTLQGEAKSGVVIIDWRAQ